MANPVISIVGRPNVGKSTLFNRLSGHTRAIVRNIHGVTRDRNYSTVDWDDHSFTLIDTGGFFPDNEDMMFTLIRQQAFYAIEEADLVIHLLDGKEGLNPLDLELARIIRSSGKKVLWAVNKIDSHEKANRVAEFYSIGPDEIFPVSAETGYGIDELMERALSELPDRQPEPETEYPKVAIVGRPNVGKSTLVNQLLGKDRMIVSPVAGTTRDPVDSLCKYYGRPYLLIDTAGIRKKSRVDETIEQMSVIKAINSIDRADIAVVVIDAAMGIMEQDQQIAGIAVRKEKGIILLFNKWDMVEEPDKWLEQLSAQVGSKLWYAAFAPVLTISALSRKRISKLFPLIDQVMNEIARKIPTAEINRFKPEIETILPSYRGRKIKLYYITQVGTRPPAFALFVNYPEGINQQHLKMIERVIRGKYPFTGSPLKIFIRARR